MYDLKVLILSLALALSANFSLAQNDSIQQQILDYRNKDVQLLENGRQMIKDLLDSSDEGKVKIIMDKLLESTPAGRMAFYLPEKWLLYYWTHQYKVLLSEVENYKSILARFKAQQRPPDDGLGFKLKEQMIIKRIILMDELKSDTLPKSDAQFLQLLLDFLMGNVAETTIPQNEMNKRANGFLHDYPESRFSVFVREHIRHEYVPANWGMGFEFSMGSAWFSGGLHDKFSNPFVVGVDFDVLYKKWVLYLRDCIGFGRVAQDLVYPSVTWKKGDKAETFFPEASLGYNFKLKERFLATPFAGLTACSISPNAKDQKKEEFDGVGLNFTTSYTIGLNIDYKIFTKPSLFSGTQYSFIRLRYGYNMTQFQKKYDGTAGQAHYLTIGFGGIARKLKRVE